MSKVFFRGSRQQARELIGQLGGMLAGRFPDTYGIARGVFLAVGFAALSDVKADFITKSRGGVGEDGVKWDALTPEYLAYGRRFGNGEQTALKKSAGLGRGHRYAPGKNKGLLTAPQLKRWNAIFARTLHRLLLSMPPAEAKARAAQIAWATLKREGARTKLEVFGHRTVEMLRDTGVLFNSLSPGEISGEGSQASYHKPTGDGGDQQIFDAIANGVVVGTNVPYARAQNARRRFLPEVAPQVWQERWADVAASALGAGVRLTLEAGI